MIISNNLFTVHETKKLLDKLFAAFSKTSLKVRAIFPER